MAFHSDLVYCKRNELPDQIVPLYNNQVRWRLGKSQRPEYEGRPFLSRKAQPVGNGSWEDVASENAIPRRIDKNKPAPPFCGWQRSLLLFLAGDNDTESTDWRRGLGGICQLLPADCLNRETHETSSLRLPPEAEHQTAVEDCSTTPYSVQHASQNL